MVGWSLLPSIEAGFSLFWEFEVLEKFNVCSLAATLAGTFEVKDLGLETDVWLLWREFEGRLMGEGLKRLGRDSARASSILRR